MRDGGPVERSENTNIVVKADPSAIDKVSEISFCDGNWPLLLACLDGITNDDREALKLFPPSVPPRMGSKMSDWSQNNATKMDVKGRQSRLKWAYKLISKQIECTVTNPLYE